MRSRGPNIGAWLLVFLWLVWPPSRLAAERQLNGLLREIEEVHGEVRELQGEVRQLRLGNWRARRLPRIEVAPDPARITVVPTSEGQAEVVGAPGAAADPRAKLARIVNLRSGDHALVPVLADGSFRAELFAPPGSWLQINTVIPALAELAETQGVPPHIREWMKSKRAVSLSDMPDLPDLPREFPEIVRSALGSHFSSSPGTILLVQGDGRGDWRGFVKRAGREVRLFGRARLSPTTVVPGNSADLEVRLQARFDSPAAAIEAAREPPVIHLSLHQLFDRHGHQRPHHRTSVSHVLTPTGLPIETHNELLGHRGPGRGMQFEPAGPGIPAPWHVEDPGAWQVEGRVASITQRIRFVVPGRLPAGHYGLGAHAVGVGQEDFDAGEPTGSPCYVGSLKVGDPDPPRLSCLLLGSSGTGGSRGAIAREDRGRFGINPRNVLMPERLILPRDDAYTGKPITYPLDPYLPMLSLADRPAPVIPAPRIALDFRQSVLKVTITTPHGRVEALGPAPLAGGQNDLSVLRPDYVFRDRVIPPVPPTYGNPSLADVYHATGRGAFDYAFKDYGRYQVQLAGQVKDLAGTSYAISGTYDLYVARPLDIDVFPEPGTPLEPRVELSPQVRVLPALPAEVEMVWRHYPFSDPARLVARKLLGKANRWGVFVPGTDMPPVVFDDPGEYVCDVTVRHEEPGGVLWMAARRGASVVVTPGSKVVVHGERGNRSPTARWRARWFVAGDGRFIAPPGPGSGDRPPEPEPGAPPPILGFGHTCLPYESGDVAWLGDHDPYSLFPGLTFEDREGSIADLVERRWPGLRQGEGRQGLYPRHLLPEDRRAIGEMPYVSTTSTGLPPTMSPRDIDQWGYFYVTSWRPGLGVRSQVSEDFLPAGYWFFDDPYGWQFGSGPQGDLAGDVKMNYGGGVVRDLATGTTHYGAYASMLVLISDRDRLGPRVLPPFDGLVPGSPPSGPLLEIGGKRYDTFVTFAAVAPGSILEVGDCLRVAGVVWPPVSGLVEGRILSPSGKTTRLSARSGPTGVFDCGAVPADEPGVWSITAEGVCCGRTSVGTISQLVPKERWPRGGALGLPGSSFSIPVVAKNAPPIAFDLPPGTLAHPPRPLLIRGQLPEKAPASEVQFIVSLPGQVIDHGVLAAHHGQFDYLYDPRRLAQRFGNLDTKIKAPHPAFEAKPAWFDTVTFTFWAGSGQGLRAGTVLLQGEEVFAQHTTGRSERDAPPPRSTMPLLRSGDVPAGPEPSHEAERDPAQSASGARAATETRHYTPQETLHSSSITLHPRAAILLAGHRWSGEVAILNIQGAEPRLAARAQTGGQVESAAFSPDGNRVYAALADRGEIVVLDAQSLRVIARHTIPAEPRAVLPAADGGGLWVADFDGDRVLRLNADTGRIEAASDRIDRPACLALSPGRDELYTTCFRSGEIVVLDPQCRILRRLPAPAQLGQCRTMTPGPDGLLYAPQTRSDTVVGGTTFDRSVFPAIAVADPRGGQVSVRYSPDLVVVPPHRPVEVAVDEATIYLASAGSDDVLALDRATGFARWHARQVGLEPWGIALDLQRKRLYVLTLTGQEIVTLDASSGRILSRTKFAQDPTPAKIARGRYLFGTATDQRITKDQWMSCAVCHPDGDEDGRQWDLGEGPLDTRSLRDCLKTPPLHVTGHIDEIQDTFQFTRMIMAGQWFVPLSELNDPLGPSNAGKESDLDALAAYIASLTHRKTAGPGRASEPSGSPSTVTPLSRFGRGTGGEGTNRRNGDTVLVRRLIARGKKLFFSPQTGCAKCHPPPWYTDSGTRDSAGRFLLHDVGTRLSGHSPSLARLDTPSLVGLRRSEPYLHHGQARSLEEVLTRYNPQDRHGRTSHLSPDDIRALAEFLRSLEVEPPPP